MTRSTTTKIPYRGKVSSLVITTINIKQYSPNGNFKLTPVDNVLVDCGSSVTLAPESIFRNLNLVIKEAEEVQLSNALNQNMTSITKQCQCNILINNMEVTNCEILLLPPSETIRYNMILGWDVLREVIMDNGIKIFPVNKISAKWSKPHTTPNTLGKQKSYSITDHKYHHVTNTRMHVYCNLECTHRWEPCKLGDVITNQSDLKKNCNHSKYPSGPQAHFRLKSRNIIPPDSTEIIEVYPAEGCEDMDLNQLQIFTSWEYRKYFFYHGFAQNRVAKNSIFVKITNMHIDTTVIMDQDTILLCGKPSRPILFYELNHLVELNDLTKEERKFHKNEYEQWKVKRETCVKNTDIKQQIKAVTDNAEAFKKELENILLDNEWVFSRNNADIGLTNKYVCELEWKNTYNGEVINKKPYKMDPKLELEVEKELQGMIENEVIETCNSSFNTALLAVRKPNGQIRLVQDYSRTINPHINLPNFPIANNRKTLNEISEHISKIKNVFKEEILISSLDIKSGFHIIPMRKAHRQYLAFKHRNKQFTWKRMAMGPKNSPSDFCCMMDQVLGDLDTEKTKIIIYVDDILIISAKSDAQRALISVLQALSSENMFVSLKKCQFFKHEVTFLGYKIHNNGFTALANKLKVIAEHPMPTTLKTAYTFAGICTYYTRYVPYLQVLLSPLHKAIAKEGKFKMTDEAILGIKEIQKKAKLGFNLEHIDWEKPVFVCADTSLIGIGACLGNCEVENNELKDIKIVAYASRSLDLQEALLSSKARECIGASWALEAFSDLIHKNQPCLLITDHLSMKSIFTGNPLTNKTSIFTRYRRAIAVLLEYDIEFIYLPNKHELIKVVDGLSRSVAYEKKPLRIKESELGLNIEIEHDISQTGQLNNIDNVVELPIIPTEPLYSKEELIKAQKEDEEILSLRAKLEKMKTDETLVFNKHQYILKKDLVHKVNSKGIPEILIPEKDAYHIIQFIHHTKDHAAFDRLIYFINRLNIHVKAKYKTTRKVVQECFLCQLSKPSTEGKERISYSLRPSLEPFTSIRADLLDFTTAGQNFKYVLTLMDTFSLYLECYFLTDKKSTTVAREIALYAVKYGLCGRSEITTDSGTEFDNKNLQKELELLNVTKLKISGYNPCSNRVERAHQEIKRLLRNQLHKRNWDIKFKIEIAVSKYNNQETKFLNYKTPFYTIFGWEADFLSSIFTIKENEEQQFDPVEEDIDDQINKWIKYRDQAYREIATDRYKNNSCTIEDLETRVETIRPNDIVAVKFPQKPGQCAKFHFQWRAPFIVRSKNLNSVKIECLHTRAIFTRNLRLVKKLKLEREFEKILRERKFICDENFFYPINDTTERTLDQSEIIETDPIKPSYNLRSRKKE